MNPTMKPLHDLVSNISEVKPRDLRLFFVSRHLKEGVSKTAKMLDKYVFQLARVDIDNPIQGLFLSIIREHFRETLSRADLRITPYQAIDDDEPKLYSYDIKNRTISFKNVLESHVLNSQPVVTDIAHFLNKEEIWAYCVQVNKGTENLFLTFTKLFRNRVAVDEKLNPENSPWSKFIRAHFNVSAAKLELLEGDTINFDRRVDCMYSFKNEQMYVFNKSNFERIASLEEEFKQVAKEITGRIKKTGIVEGLDSVSNELENDTALHKRLYRLAREIEGQKLDSHRVEKMKAICKKFKLRLQIKNGKAQVKSKQDLDEVIRLLEDYYLESEQTGIKYGASVKTKLS